MSADNNAIVPVDVDVAMRHLVSEIAGLKDMRQRDATSMVEALAGAGVRSVSPGVIEGWE